MAYSMTFNNNLHICRWKGNKTKQKNCLYQRVFILHIGQDCLCPQKVQEIEHVITKA